MLWEPELGSGFCALRAKSSGGPITVVVAFPVLLTLFGSEVTEAATASLLITVAFGVVGLTFTTIENCAVSPAATVVFEKTTLPVPPTAGELMDQPVPVLTEALTKVVSVGVASVTVTVCASLGPALAKSIV